jgi:hypothetical protein
MRKWIELDEARERKKKFANDLIFSSLLEYADRAW